MPIKKGLTERKDPNVGKTKGTPIYWPYLNKLNSIYYLLENIVPDTFRHL